MSRQVSRNDFALRVLQAKRQIGTNCQYCHGEYKFTKGKQLGILIAVCSSCGGRAKERLDGQGHKLPPIEIVTIFHI